jgi:membrane protease YdiL (CAAX protease family)
VLVPKPEVAEPIPSSQHNSRISDLVVVLFVGFGTTVISNLSIILGPARTYSPFELNAGILGGLITEIGCLGVLFTILHYRRQPLSSLGLRFDREDFLPGIGMFFCAYAVFVALYYSALAVRPSLGVASAGFDFNQFGSSSPALLTLFMLVNPCFEEIVVRGYFSTELVALTKLKWVAVIVPALFQGSYHLYQGRLTAISFTGMFLLFSIYFMKTRRLVPVVIAHTVFDLTLIWRLWA